jgi:putative autoinducer-2 (AI-2) aldolase
MPEPDTRENKNFEEDVPAPNQGFFLKGSSAYDWGMKNRLARIFRPQSGRTVMLAIDHGYFQGPTTGLERVDLGIVPIAPHADALMLTRGMLRSTIPPSHRGGVVMRAAAGRASSPSYPTSGSRSTWKMRCG